MFLSDQFFIIVFNFLHTYFLPHIFFAGILLSTPGRTCCLGRPPTWWPSRRAGWTTWTQSLAATTKRLECYRVNIVRYHGFRCGGISLIDLFPHSVYLLIILLSSFSIRLQHGYASRIMGHPVCMHMCKEAEPIFCPLDIRRRMRKNNLAFAGYLADIRNMFFFSCRRWPMHWSAWPRMTTTFRGQRAAGPRTSTGKYLRGAVPVYG